MAQTPPQGGASTPKPFKGNPAGVGGGKSPPCYFGLFALSVLLPGFRPQAFKVPLRSTPGRDFFLATQGGKTPKGPGYLNFDFRAALGVTC